MNKKANIRFAVRLTVVLLVDIVIAAMILGGFAYTLLLAPKPAPPITSIPTPTVEHTFSIPTWDDYVPPITADSTKDSIITPVPGTVTPDATPTVTPAVTLTPTPTPVPTVVPWQPPTNEQLGCNAVGNISRFGYYVLDNKRYEASEFGRTVRVVADDTCGDGRFLITEVVIGEGDEKITYYAVDIYVTKATDIMTHVVIDKDGNLGKEEVPIQAAACNAKLAISGDYFRSANLGYIVRNGVEYRDERALNDYCILYLDGTVKCIPGPEFDKNQEQYEKNAWQVWSFGPSLLDSDGSYFTSYNDFNINEGAYHSTDILNNGIQVKHPRSVFGYVEPGHYMFVIVDGRTDDHSCGANLIELSKIMYDEGCSVAYNLDGGRSASLCYNGVFVNKPYKGGRAISDIIYIKG